MYDDVSIQSLFAQLRREHVLSYVLSKGWLDVPGGALADRVRYELANGDTPYIVYLPKAGVKAKKLLQSVVYNLSGVEDRQPREIIFDMLAMEPAEEPKAADPDGVRLRLANSDATNSITLKVSTRPGETLLMPGEAMEFLLNPSDGQLVEVSVQKVCT